MAEISEQSMVDQVVGRLADKHSDVPADRVRAIVNDVYAQFEQSPIRDFIPLFVERRAAAALTNSQVIPCRGLRPR